LSVTDTDEILTVFRVVGAQQYQQSFQRAAAANSLLANATSALNPKLLAAGAIMTAGAEGLQFWATSAQAAATAQEQVNRASANFRGRFPVAELEDWAEGLSRLTGIDDEKLAALAGVLGSFGASRGAATELVGGIIDVAEAMKDAGVTAENLNVQIGRALKSGEIGRAGRMLGIDPKEFRAARTEAERVAIIMAALRRINTGAAAEFRESWSGTFQAFQTELGNLHEAIGDDLIQPFKDALEVGTAGIRLIRDAKKEFKELGELFGFLNRAVNPFAPFADILSGLAQISRAARGAKPGGATPTPAPGAPPTPDSGSVAQPDYAYFD
jgi:hypothetical protein